MNVFQARRIPLAIAVAALLLALVYIAYSLSALAQRPPRESRGSVTAPDVSVVTILPGTYEASVEAYGAVDAHYTATLAAKVSGYATVLSPAFEAGGVVTQGQTLLQLEDSDYRSALFNAQESLALARLALLEEQRQAVQAQAEWRGAGLEGEPDSELVLRQPYVDAALASVKSAEADAASAQVDLDHTQIAAPFNAIVVERLVAPGSYVQAGSDIATLFSSDRVEIGLALSAADWRKLPPVSELQSGNWPVFLRDIESGDNWTGYVSRVAQHLDSTTRQRAVIVAVDRPLQQTVALLPGTFVDARIPGRAIEGLWQLPNSALSQRGEIWYVAPDNTLASFVADLSFSEGDKLYVIPPAALAGSAQQVLLHPLSGYLVGMPVTPVAAEPTPAITLDTQEQSNNG
jgi:RND family efflux transporter MFP subunit